MAGRLAHKIAAVAIALSMLATPALAAPAGSCGGVCCQRATGALVPDLVEPTHCCSSSGRRLEITFSATDAPAFRCCQYSSVVPPSVPPSRDGRLDVAVEAALAGGPFTALLLDAAHPRSIAASVEGPFWSASDGPSRQAFLCRFTI
jgi:hypothetical protein